MTAFANDDDDVEVQLRAPMDEPLPSKSGLPGSSELARRLAETRTELAEAALVLLCCVLFAFDTLPGLMDSQRAVLTLLDYGSCVSFAVLYCLRWYAASLSPRHVLKPLELVDLVSFLPMLLNPFSTDPEEAYGSGLQVLRLLRVLRLQRFVVDEESFRKLQQALSLAPPDEHVARAGASSGRRGLSLRTGLRVARVVSSVLTLLFVSTGLVYEAEYRDNPAMPTFFDALYFGLTTLTTVGYGDITPVTLAGRLVVCGSIVAGVAIVPVQLAELGEALLAPTGDSWLEEAQKTTPHIREAPSREAPSREGSRPPTTLTREAPPPSSPGLLSIDLAQRCHACGETTHISASSYCRCCGAALDEE